MHLDRALALGQSVAMKYVEELKKRGQLPENIESVDEAVEYLSEDLYDFFFKNLIPGQGELDEQMDE